MKIEKLLKLTELTPISQLKKDQVRELQAALNKLGFNAGPVDGAPGSKTRNAWLAFIAAAFGTNMILIGPDAARLLQKKLGGSTGPVDPPKPPVDPPKDPDPGDLTLKLKLLAKIRRDTPIGDLNREQLRELQTGLYRLGYPVGELDGLIGTKTRTAWAEFEKDVYGGNKLLIGPVSVDILQKKLDKVGSGRIHDFSTKEGTIEAIIWECSVQKIGLKTQIAYVLATVEWETGRTFKPVKEAYWLSEEWREENLRYFPYYGRGFVQITWERNYQKYSEILGIDLVANPDLAMNENIALFILVHGFKTGAFTGRKITDYIDDTKTEFVDARRCINGTDHDEDIAKLAENYLEAM
ncbi:MAG: hypothetical protein HKN25_13410 [Pyrinomonadaceae bacterium]|nr:hypothetical protein [Pyrinomonadaceae bacterium]